MSYPPAPPSSPAARRPHVVVFPPEEDCDPPWCCYDADEPLDTDPDVISAIHSMQDDDEDDHEREEDSEIFEVVRVRRRQSEDQQRPPPKRRSSFFSFRKSQDTPRELPSEPSRSVSPTPTFLSRSRFSFFSSTPSLPALSRRSESNSSLSSGPDTPIDDAPPAKPGLLRRLSSFRRSKPPPPPVPILQTKTQPTPPVMEDTDGEMRLDSFHFDEGISFDPQRFTLE